LQETKPKLVVMPKHLNADSVRSDMHITLSPLLSCIEAEQALSEWKGLFKIIYNIFPYFTFHNGEICE